MSTLRATAQSVTQRLIDAGYTALYAGGCVRDSLLSQAPKDYDIATSATPEQVKTLFPKADSIGAHFGVMLVKKNCSHFEIATFRNDGSYHDGRRPESVTYSTPEEDALRRDFTINGLFEHPLSGEIIDFVNGQADLSSRKIRAIGDANQRFSEDALRLMRAVRFACVLDFEIETDTLAAIKNNSHKLQQISIERVRDEFNKILLSPNRAKGLELLRETNLLSHFLPEVLELIGCEQPPQWHPEGDVYQHTKIMLHMLKEKPSLELVLSVLFHDIGKPATYTYSQEEDRIRFNGHDAVGADMTEEILRRMRYPNQTIEATQAMVANHMNFMHVRQMRTAKVKRFLARPHIQDEMELHRVDCASSNGITENYDFLREKEQEFANQPIIPQPLLKGSDLIELGYTPGPHFKNILTAIQTEQLEGHLNTTEQASAWVQRHFPLQ